jgi:hypothetical protein
MMMTKPTTTASPDRILAVAADTTVANEIARQIGRRAFAMLGTTMKVGDGDSLLFNVRGSTLANKVRVRLDASDTYTVISYKATPSPVCDFVVIAETAGVYDDVLHATIEHHTGLYLAI